MRIAGRRLTCVTFLITLLTGSVAAQDALSPTPLPTPGDLQQPPRQLSLPDLSAPLDSSAVDSLRIGETIDPETGTPDMWLLDPARVWSSGTWLERGFWYAEEEAVILVREFDRRNVLLARDVAGSQRTLQIRTRHPGALANARITLGRFLFRDLNNWDHNVETTFMGAGREFQSGTVTSIGSNGLTVPSGEQITAFRFLNNLDLNNFSFDGSDRQAFTYTHRLNSLEFNYHVKQRMDRDHMVLLPSGQWVRRAAPTVTKNYIAGLRWFSSNEWFVWDAEHDPTSNGTSGNMRITAKNDLIGGQLGGAMGHKWARFSVNFTGKGGVYVNFARVNRTFEVVNQPSGGPSSVLATSDVRAEEEALAFLGSFQALARYHLHPNFSLRLAYDLMYVDSLALAPFQITFTPAFTALGLSGGNLYQGVSFGIEGYW